MFQNIVVGTDGSERAGRAVARAVDLAALSGATGAGRILGSVPAAIAREAPCAVLIVPTQ